MARIGGARRALKVFCLPLVVGALSISGCSSNDEGSDEEAKTQGPLIIAAYEHYWSALLVASDPADPDSPELPKVAIAPEVDRARGVLASRRQAGVAVRGSYEHTAKVESVAGQEAHVTDCLTVKTESFDAKTGKSQRKDPSGPFPVSVTLTLQGGVWKVSDIAAGTRACGAPGTTGPSPQPTAS